MLIQRGLIVILAVGTLLSVACSGSSNVVDETETIPAGQSISWDVSQFDECKYHFTVRQTGTLGDVDIAFQGRRYTEKDGIFYGDTFVLDNGYSLGTAKVVDIRLQCK